MTKELTQEEIVTKLLSSNEILKNTKEDNAYVTSVVNLGEYLRTLPNESSIETKKTEDTKYTFIKDGGWKF